jgi:hypothetical protein
VSPEHAGALGVEANGDGTVQIEVDDPVPVLARITSTAMERRIPLNGLEVNRVTLEDAYLRLVGEDDG